jgi:hypothetical protein
LTAWSCRSHGLEILRPEYRYKALRSPVADEYLLGYGKVLVPAKGRVGLVTGGRKCGRQSVALEGRGKEVDPQPTDYESVAP